MEESGKAKSDSEISKDRLSEATSEETLKDLEDKKEISEPNTGTGGDNTPVPTPDGQPDENRKDPNGVGPM
jgi:hypothetical protein